MSERINEKRVFLGFMLVALGIIWALIRMDFIPDYFDRVDFWKGMLLVVGIILLATNENKAPGLVITAIGAFLVIPELFDIPYYFFRLFWPFVLVILGVYILLRATSSHKKKEYLGTTDQINSDYIDEMAVFGGGEKNIHTSNFAGGKVTAIFGGYEIYLTNSTLAQGVSVIDSLAIFGGVSYIIPQDWHVKIDIVPIFGGFTDKRLHNPGVPIDTSKTLIIKGVVIFGGGEVKNFK